MKLHPTRKTDVSFCTVDDVRTPLADRIEAWIAAERLTQETAAARLGVSQSTISRWLDGVIPTGESRRRLSEVMGLETNQLIDLVEPTVGSVESSTVVRYSVETSAGVRVAAITDRLASGLAPIVDELRSAVGSGIASEHQAAIARAGLEELRECLEQFASDIDHIVNSLGR